MPLCPAARLQQLQPLVHALRQREGGARPARAARAGLAAEGAAAGARGAGAPGALGAAPGGRPRRLGVRRGEKAAGGARWGCTSPPGPLVARLRSVCMESPAGCLPNLLAPLAESSSSPQVIAYHPDLVPHCFCGPYGQLREVPRSPRFVYDCTDARLGAVAIKFTHGEPRGSVALSHCRI
jgi:hypothetical protein